jgi:hypothetical protein
MMGGFVLKRGLNIDYLCITMTIDEVYKFINFITKKSSAGGYISPEEFNLVINRAQVQYFNKLYGNQNDYRYDRPVPKISYAVTEKISNSLSPFLESTNLTTDANGQAAIPATMFQTVSLTKDINNVPYEVTRVEQDRVANNLTSYYDAPDSEFPIYTQLKDKYQFYPKTQNIVYKLFYLRKPEDMVWGYTVVSNRPVYNAGTSVQPKWEDVDMNEIIYIALSYIGINLKDGDVSQFAQLKTQTGL